MHLIGLMPEGYTPRAGASALGAAFVRQDAMVGAAAMVGSVPVIDIDGPILHDPGVMDVLMGGVIPTAAVVAVLEQITAAKLPLAVLKINSPGGSIAGLTDIRAAIERCQAGGTRLVALVTGMLASAAVPIAAWCDEVVAVETAMVGSIGVAFPGVRDYSENYAKMGVKSLGIARPARKAAQADPAMPKPAGSYDDLEKACEEMYARMCAWIDEGRGIAAGTAAATDARVMLASEALAIGLVDRVVPDAASFLAELSGLAERLGRQLNQPPRVAGLSAADRGMKGTSMDLKTITMDDLRASRPDLVAQMNKSPATLPELVKLIGDTVPAKAFAAEACIKGMTLTEAVAAWSQEITKATTEALTQAQAKITALSAEVEGLRKLGNQGRGAAPLAPSGTPGAVGYLELVEDRSARLQATGMRPERARVQAFRDVRESHPEAFAEYEKNLAFVKRA